ncbi:heteropolysaccharide repeat-containing protein [Erysipelotrichaceae bacterium OPF54]|nr:heteropolysaccharide repeat-containing protein [Erysipelotrichaceae bacterium OPF54]
MKTKSLKINAVLNVIKQCCTLLFPLITFPYISRILGADNYGKVNFSMTFVNYFFLIAALGISTYAIREGSALRNDKKKFQLFANQIFTINIISTIVAYLILTLSLLIFNNLDSYKLLISIGSLGIIFTTLGRDWINTIYEDFGYLTVRYIVTQSLSVFFILFFVKEKNDTILYTWIITLAPIIANICNIFYIRKYVKLHISFHINWKKHLQPIIILFANAIAISIYMNIDITMLGLFKSDNEVGIYSVAVKIYSMIKQLINALIIVAIPRFSYLAVNNRIQSYELLASKILNSIISILIPAVVGLCLLSKEIIFIISGSEYTSGYHAMQILSISLIFAIIASFFAQGVLIPFRKETLLVKATLISAVLNIVLNFIFIPLLSYNGAAFTTMIAELGMCILCINFVKRDISFTLNRNTIITVGMGCLFISIICISLKLIIQDLVLYTILSVVISIFFYGLILIWNKNDIIYPIIVKITSKIKIICKK